MNTELLNREPSQDRRDLLGNMCMGAAGLAVGSAGATFDIGNAFSYTIDHRLYLKAAEASVAITAVGAQSVSTERMYMAVIDDAGDAVIVGGDEADTGDGVHLPEVPAGTVPIGAFKIACDATHTYTPGTTLNSATGITDTYYDLARWVPDAF